MRLTDVVNQVGRRAREVFTFIRHPDQILFQQGRRQLQELYEKTEIPKGGQRSQDLGSQEPEEIRTHPSQARSPQEHSQNNQTSPEQPIISEQPLLVSHPRISFASSSAFLNSSATQALEVGRELRGGRGNRYAIVALIEDQEGQKSRLYQAVQTLNERIVLLKEYLLLRENLSDRDIEEYLDRFEDLANLNISEEQSQRFRLVIPQDVIVDRQEKRCYLVTDALDRYMTLEEWMKVTGTITFAQTIKILDDILQTLWFLHNHKFRFGGSLKQSLAHRNINPESIKIVLYKEQEAISETPFSVYLSDLALWQNLVLSSTIPQNQFKPIFDDPTQQDFIDLGYLCLYLLSEGEIEGYFGRAVDPQTIEDKLALISASALEMFVRKLLGIEEQFTSAEEARKYLRTIQNIPLVIIPEPVEDAKKKVKENRQIIAFLVKLLLLVGAIALAGLLVKLFWGNISNKAEQPLVVTTKQSKCCLSQISIGQGTQQLKYATVRGSHWHNIFAQKTGVFPLEIQNHKKYPEGKTLKDEIEERYPAFSKKYIYQCSEQKEQTTRYSCPNTNEKIIQDLAANKIDFALLRKIEKLPDRLEQQVVAYDLVVPVVAFSSYTRDRGIAQSLQGKVSLEQLRAIYTGKARSIQGQTIEQIYFAPRLYESEIRQLFEEFLRKTLNANIANDEIQDFRKNYAEILKKDQSVKTNIFLEQILSNFENEGIVSIGLTFLSSVFAQCSVYPLAIVKGDDVLQAVIQNNGKPITPQIDLCNDKGNYFPTYTPALESGEFPLVYSLVVVYPKNERDAEAGKQFAEMLKTDEGQYLMREMGLIPVRKLRRY